MMDPLIETRPGSSVGSSVRLKSERSPVRFRPWPQKLGAPRLLALNCATQLRRREHIAHDRVRAPWARVPGPEVDQRLHTIPPAKQVGDVQYDPADPRQDPLEL